MNGSLQRLHTLLRKLKRTDMLTQYDAIIREQIEQGIVEKAPTLATSEEFYLPHQPVVREDAETTKIQIVYDASARHRQTSAKSLFLRDITNCGR